MAEEYDRIFKKSLISGIPTLLKSKYGDRQGGQLYAQAGERLLDLIAGADDRGNAAIHYHINQNILPVIACYQVLQKNGISQKEAGALISDFMHARIKSSAKVFHRLSHMPFFYPLFRTLFRRTMAKSYPNIGWDVHWLQDDNKGIAFDCRSCVYRDTTLLFGCPELCQYFCESDVILYGALQPNVRFSRTQTLAAGGNRCDFRFLNGKTMKGQVQ